LHERHMEFESYAPAELRDMIEPRERRQAYLGMAAILNSLPISNKAWIGREIESRSQRVRKTGQSTCFTFRQLLGAVVFVFAIFTKFTRTEKMRALNQFLAAAHYSSGMTEALGIAYDADDENMGFEVCWRKGPVEANHAVRELAARLFSSSSETLCPTPFGDPRPYSPTATNPAL
jgi:hypothetical protein